MFISALPSGFRCHYLFRSLILSAFIFSQALKKAKRGDLWFGLFLRSPLKSQFLASAVRVVRRHVLRFTIYPQNIFSIPPPLPPLPPKNRTPSSSDTKTYNLLHGWTPITYIKINKNSKQTSTYMYRYTAASSAKTSDKMVRLRSLAYSLTILLLRSTVTIITLVPVFGLKNSVPFSILLMYVPSSCTLFL